MAFTFKKGVHPDYRKFITENKTIEKGLEPERVFIPLSQHLGKPAELIVAVGERVVKGQLIAKASGVISANIFASVSGTIKGIVTMANIQGLKVSHVEIENDFSEDEFLLPALENPTKEEIITRLFDAGIVGMGGAAFPTVIKAQPPKEDIIDTLIINGAECEPYITCDYRIFLELTEEFLSGVEYLKTALGVCNVIIGIEENKIKAIEHLQTFKNVNIARNKRQLDSNKINIAILKTKYPQGAEKQLIYAVTKRVVKEGMLPSSIGVCVNNVHTALSTYFAVKTGRTLYKRIMTVSGKAVKNPGNMWIKTGVPYSVIAKSRDVDENELAMIVSGGPMMGFSVYSEDICTTKATSSILFLSEEEINFENPSVCIGCGKCASVCPMNLMPMFIDSNVLISDYVSAKKYGALSCIECGCCAYSCPAKRPLVQSIKLAKKIIKEKKI